MIFIKSSTPILTGQHEYIHYKTEKDGQLCSNTMFRVRAHIQGFTWLWNESGSSKWPLPPRISLGNHEWLSEAEMKELEEKYTPPIVKKRFAKKVGGHGGMDL